MPKQYITSVIEDDIKDTPKATGDKLNQYLFSYCQVSLDKINELKDDLGQLWWREDKREVEANGNIIFGLAGFKDEEGVVLAAFLQGRAEKAKKLESAVALIASEAEATKVANRLQTLGINIPVVKRSDWEVYAYPGGINSSCQKDETRLEEPEKTLKVKKIKKRKAVKNKPDSDAIIKKINERPEYLLVFDSVSCDNFFKLDWEKIENKLKVLDKLPKDHPSLKRWMWMKEIRKIGKEKLLLKYPDLKTIELE